eukprot:Platyproteum_vivax@DN6004_c0_g1_i1.p2
MSDIEIAALKIQKYARGMSARKEYLNKLWEAFEKEDEAIREKNHLRENESSKLIETANIIRKHDEQVFLQRQQTINNEYCARLIQHKFKDHLENRRHSIHHESPSEKAEADAAAAAAAKSKFMTRSSTQQLDQPSKCISPKNIGSSKTIEEEPKQGNVSVVRKLSREQLEARVAELETQVQTKSDKLVSAVENQGALKEKNEHLQTKLGALVEDAQKPKQGTSKVVPKKAAPKADGRRRSSVSSSSSSIAPTAVYKKQPSSKVFSPKTSTPHLTKSSPTTKPSVKPTHPTPATGAPKKAAPANTPIKSDASFKPVPAN